MKYAIWSTAWSSSLAMTRCRMAHLLAGRTRSAGPLFSTRDSHPVHVGAWPLVDCIDFHAAHQVGRKSDTKIAARIQWYFKIKQHQQLRLLHRSSHSPAETGRKQFRGFKNSFEQRMRKASVYKLKNTFYLTALSLFKCIFIERTRDIRL